MCVCVCVCVCVHARMCVCGGVHCTPLPSMCVCVCLCVYVHAHTFVCVCPLCSTVICVCVCGCVCAHMHVRVHVCKYSDFAEVIQAPRIQCQDCTKRNTEPKLQQPRGRETYTCATTNPELGIFWTGKQINHKTCLEILMIVCFLLLCFLLLLIFEC